MNESGNVTRLVLPDGGSFDLPLPGSSAKLVERGGGVLTSPAECPSALVPVLIGAVLGAGLTWLVVRASR
jgi:hypothetical protein